MRPAVSTLLAGLLAASVAGLPSPAAAEGDDDLTSGLVTSEMLDATPPGFRVSWIRWDSGFRKSGLQIGDRIIAVDGVRFVKPRELPELQRLSQTAIGQYAENQRWKQRGARDGTTVTLTVRRRAPGGVGAQILEVKGRLRAEAIYSSPATGRRTFGPGGPEEMKSDEFDESWSGWYEAQIKRYQKVLDLGWTQQRITSRVELAGHLEDRKRIDFLVARYPGPFAAAMKEDWERVQASLLGVRYQLGEKDLAYRRLGEERAAEIAAAGKAARAAFLKAHAAETIPPFPAIDPIRGDRSKVSGKLVALPAVGNRDWVSEAGHGYIVVGDAKRGWYFVDAESEAFVRVLRARLRYEKYVTPRITETYAVVGRVKESPRMLVVRGRVATGIDLEPVAATIGQGQGQGQGMFVDLTVIKDKASPFAGEAALAAPGDVKLPDGANPRQVMETLIAALKVGDEKTWKGLFASWRAERWKETNEYIYHPFHEPRLDSTWTEARRLILDTVCDARVIYVSDPEPVLTGKEFPHAPRIDEVLVEIDHVGREGGEYRSFTDVTVRRVWALQRRDGGPWRITSEQGL